MTFRQLRHRLSAFTLIELLVVISIIGILITLTFVAIIPIQRKSRDARRKADVNSMLAAANLFKADFKIYPNPTFYLGSFGGTQAEKDYYSSLTPSQSGVQNPNSNYGLDNDVPSCNSATLGATATFASDSSTHTSADLLASPITLKPGFTSVNNFLICFRYIDKVLADPKLATVSPVDAYQYRVSYDYGDVLIAARLENTNDVDATRLFTDTLGAAYKEYYKGSGVVVRHLDDSSDTSSFTTGSANTNNDSNYLYQCKVDNTSAAIIKDNRVNNEPIISSGAGYILNTSCQNSPAGQDVEPSN